jgi:hypothetical protein
MNNEQIKELAEEALNTAIHLIQERMGVQTGDLAGIFFSGEDPARFEAYIRTELSTKEE